MKKYLMILLAMCLVVCIVACGGNKEQETTTEDPGVENTTPGEDATDETTTEDLGTLPPADEVKDPAEKDPFRK